MRSQRGADGRTVECSFFDERAFGTPIVGKVQVVGKVQALPARNATREVRSLVGKLGPYDHFIGTCWQLKLQTTLLVELQRSRYVQVGNLDLLGPGPAAPVVCLRVDGSTHDRVAAHFFLPSVTEYEHGGRKLVRGWLNCILPPWHRRPR